MKRIASRALFAPRLQAALLLLASCSLQNFDYLQDGGGGGATGGSGGSVAGSSHSFGGSDVGGEAPADAGRGGSGGSSAGRGGDGNDPSAAGDGSGEEGGMPGAAGEGLGVAGTNTGGTSTGGSATGGAGGSGATGQLVNPSFETGTTNGWTVEPADALSKRHAFVQYPQGASKAQDGTYEFSTWHMTDTYTVQLYQIITGLDDGTYTFKGYFARGAQNAAVIYARNCGGADLPAVDIPVTQGTDWVAVSVTGIEVSGGSCEVGIGVDSNPENWLNADLFTFEKEPE